MDSDLNSVKIDLYDVSMTLGSKESEGKLNGLKSRMVALKDKSKKIAEMVMFCLDNKRKMDVIIAAYCQLVLKKQELQKELDQLYINLHLKRPEL